MNQAQSLEDFMDERDVRRAEVRNSARELGVTHCDGCGEAVVVVGALRSGARDGDRFEGLCEYCSKKAEVELALEEEIRAVVHAWIASCKRRKIKSAEIQTVMDGAFDIDSYFEPPRAARSEA